MMSPEEVLARKLCQWAGNGEAACDELVYLTPTWEINTPKGKAHGGVASQLRPLWTCWLEEAINMRAIAQDMAAEMLKGR